MFDQESGNKSMGYDEIIGKDGIQKGDGKKLKVIQQNSSNKRGKKNREVNDEEQGEMSLKNSDINVNLKRKNFYQISEIKEEDNEEMKEQKEFRKSKFYEITHEQNLLDDRLRALVVANVISSGEEDKIRKENKIQAKTSISNLMPINKESKISSCTVNSSEKEMNLN